MPREWTEEMQKNPKFHRDDSMDDQPNRQRVSTLLRQLQGQLVERIREFPESTLTKAKAEYCVTGTLKAFIENLGVRGERRL